MRILYFIIALVALGLAPFGTVAQTDPTASAPTESRAPANAADYTAWNTRADAIEAELEQPDLSIDRLEALRNELVEYRSQFQDARNVNAPRIESLRAQIEALGPVPEDPATEAPEIIDRRATLAAELAALQAPRAAGQEAFSRADTLVRRIDTLLRARQADALLAVEPYPWNPTNWIPTATTLLAASSTIVTEFNNTLGSQLRMRQLRENLPVIVGLLAFGVFVLLRGRAWIERLVLSLRGGGLGTRVLGNSPKGQRLLGLLLSFSQVIVPSLAVIALYSAAYLSTLLAERGGAMAEAIAALGIIYFTARWIGLWLFPASGHLYSPLLLTDGQRTQGRVLVNLLGLFTGLHGVALAAIGGTRAPAAALSVLIFPIIILTAIVLFRLGQLFIQHAKANAASGQDTAFKDRAIGLVGRAALPISLAAPVLAALGYRNAAEALIFPTIESLALFAVPASGPALDRRHLRPGHQAAR